MSPEGRVVSWTSREREKQDNTCRHKEELGDLSENHFISPEQVILACDELKAHSARRPPAIFLCPTVTPAAPKCPPFSPPRDLCHAGINCSASGCDSLPCISASARPPGPDGSSRGSGRTGRAARPRGAAGHALPTSSPTKVWRRHSTARTTVQKILVLGTRVHGRDSGVS